MANVRLTEETEARLEALSKVRDRTPMAPANLSSKPILVFRAKSEIPISVMIFAQHLGRIPATIRVESVPAGKEHRVDLRKFVRSTHDITGIFFGFTSAQSSFELTLDDIRLES